MEASTSGDSILLIEGDRIVAERVRGELRSEGFPAVEVRTLAEARERIRSSRFSAILVDTRLPDGSVYDDLPALGRRVSDLLASSPSPLTARVRCRDLEVDRLRREASVRGIDLPLTPIELRLLEWLVVAGVDGATTEELLNAGWAGDPPRSSNALAVHIGHLRRKLESAGTPHRIECVRRVGYALRCPAEGHDDI